MKQTITKSMFREIFKDYNRGDNFSYEGLGALYDLLEEEYDGDFELDVIGLCCEFNEEAISDVLENYNLSSLEELNENTLVVWHDEENVLYQAY